MQRLDIVTFSYCAPYYYGPGVVLVRGGVRVESKRTEPATEQGEATAVRRSEHETVMTIVLSSILNPFPSPVI